MRAKFGILFMLLGVMLILGALGLFFYNIQEDQDAEQFSAEMITALQEEVRHIQESIMHTTEPNILDNTPVELLTEEDLAMTEFVIKGHAYIGYVSIPDLRMQLPVMADYNTQKLQISPCRYSGTLRGKDLVIMAHSFKSHFGNLDTLSEGSKIQFTDMDGKVWYYEVIVKDILDAYDVEEMVAGEYDLTLFTCTKDRQHRMTIRCNLIENKNGG